LALLLWGLLCATASAAIFEIAEPKDKTTTYQGVLYLKGQSSNLSALTVNGTSIDVKPDGTFICGLVLRRGKNLVQVTGWDKSGKVETKNIRVLHLIVFPDVEQKYGERYHWARREIITLSTLGIVEGFPDGNYYVDRELSRGEVATYLARAKNLPKVYLQTDPFTDVPKEHWRAPYIAAIANQGWMSGKAGAFGMDEGLRREQVAGIVAKIEGKKASEDIEALFYDVPKSDPYAYSIALVRKRGLIKGVSKQTPLFDPNRAMTRAEGAILFSRFSFVKQMQKWLYDFNQGYNKATLSGINTQPRIIWVNITPPQISLLNETNQVNIVAKVEDREGLKNIVNVRADISQLGGPPDALLEDSGKMGDAKADDGQFTLSFITSTEVWGDKFIDVTVLDKYGWEAAARGTITVVR